MLAPTTFRAVVSGRRRGLGAFGIRALFRLFSIPYRMIVDLRNCAFDRGWCKTHQVRVPVISVGNLTLGGTGKTPFVAWLSKWLIDQNISPAIVSRGYKQGHGERNDEAMELAEKLPGVPHVQNPNRTQAVETAIKQYAVEAIVLDDGFQHRRLARDLDVVLIDAMEPFGFEYMFPRGTLREPLSSLRRADAVALTRVDRISAERLTELKNRVQSIAPHVAWLELAYRTAFLTGCEGDTVSIETFHDACVFGFCGIGNPENFARTLNEEPWHVQQCEEYPDHYHYTQADSERLSKQAASSGATVVLCTHKDLVKIRSLWRGSIPLYAVMLETEIRAGEEALSSLLRKLTDALQ